MDLESPRSEYVALSEVDCGPTSNCEGYKLYGSYSTHQPRDYLEGEHRTLENYETHEYFDIEMHLEIPEH